MSPCPRTHLAHSQVKWKPDCRRLRRVDRGPSCNACHGRYALQVCASEQEASLAHRQAHIVEGILPCTQGLSSRQHCAQQPQQQHASREEEARTRSM